MGCSFNNNKNLTPIKPCKTVNGLLKVTVQQAHFQSGGSKLFGMDPYLKLRMSNQYFKGYIHKKSSRQALFNQSFQFVINSCYKCNGRSLEMELWDQCSINDRMIGMGAIDIDPLINLRQCSLMETKMIDKAKQKYIPSKQGQIQNQNAFLRKNQCRMKIFLTHKLVSAGFLNTLFQFYQQPYQVIGFKFLYANLRRKSSVFATMNVWIQVIAGQQILSTHKQKDKNSKNPPSWQEQVLMFNIPACLKHFIIRVLDDNKQIGKMKIPVVQIIEKKGEHHYTEQLQHHQTVSGVLKFTVFVGMQLVISQKKKQSAIRTQDRPFGPKVNQINLINQKDNRKLEQTLQNQSKILKIENQGNDRQKQNLKQSKQTFKQQNLHENQQLQQNQRMNNFKTENQQISNLKMYQSVVQTDHYTHGNNQQHSRTHTLDDSRIITDNY